MLACATKKELPSTITKIPSAVEDCQRQKHREGNADVQKYITQKVKVPRFKRIHITPQNSYSKLLKIVQSLLASQEALHKQRSKLKSQAILARQKMRDILDIPNASEANRQINKTLTSPSDISHIPPPPPTI